MKYIICYDIKEDKIRSQLVKYLEGMAFRLQFSVFTCRCSSKEIKAVWKKMIAITKGADNPLLMVIPVCKACEKDVLMHGRPLEEDSPVLIV